MGQISCAHKVKKCLFAVSLLLYLKPLFADQLLPGQEHKIGTLPVISIIIDDLGYNHHHGKQVIDLPAALTVSLLPHSPHAKELAELAHQQGKEIMLHLPMESDDEKKLGPGGLTQVMTQQQLVQVMEDDLSSIPYAKGFNNHMGSLLTRDHDAMDRVMKIAARTGLYFVDSRTTSETVALNYARKNGISAVKRDIFLDHIHNREFIQAQLDKLIRRANSKGEAVAIAHPHSLTLEVLKQWLVHLDQQAIKLVPVSQLIQIRNQRRLAWQESSSR